MEEIYIVDDHPLLRKAMISILTEQSLHNYKFVEFGLLSSFLDHYFASTNKPLAIFLDLELPDGSGFEALNTIKETFPNQKIIMLSVHSHAGIIKHAFDNGADAFMSKEIALDEIIECLDLIVLGDRYFPTDFMESMYSPSTTDSIIDKLSNLTKSEMRVLKYVSEKLSSKDIAEHMHINKKSVDNYRTRISKKLNLEYRNSSLLIWSLENKKMIDLLT